MTNILDRVLNQIPNPVSTKFFLCDSPLPITALIIGYVLFVKRWGPNLMKNRKPYELKGLLIAYNSFQVVLNIFLFYNGSVLIYHYASWDNHCYIIKTDDPHILSNAISLSHAYCILKIIDMLDTVFFVLRKRYDQVTFLHFYHHILMSVGIWLSFRYQPCSHGNIVGLINTIVHSVMYFYYLLAAAHLIDNSIWWKKYVTLMQITQFTALLLFLAYPAIHGEDCGYPLKMIPFAVAQTVVMLVLFANFYMQAYVLKKK